VSEHRLSLRKKDSISAKGLSAEKSSKKKAIKIKRAPLPSVYSGEKLFKKAIEVN